MKHYSQHIRLLVFLLGGVFLLNWAGSYIYKRFDLTKDERYTLSEEAIRTVAPVNSSMYVDVFLEGNFPSEFKKLQSETEQLLLQFSEENPNIKFEFLNGVNAMAEAEANFTAAEAEFQKARTLFQKQQITEAEWKPIVERYNREGRNYSFLRDELKPAQVQVQENGKVSNELVFPWAVAYYNEKSVVIPLLKNNLGATMEDRVNSSIQNLEYAFANGFTVLTTNKQKRVAFLKGNGELDDLYLADFLSTVREYYQIAPFTLDSVAKTPQRTLNQLKTFDLAIIAKPTEAFTEEEKFVIDQFVMHGGNTLWLVDGAQVETDPTNGKIYATATDLNLGDLFFKYGIRINQDLVKDMYAAPIVLASGTNNASQYNKYPWFLSPLSSSANTHPITTNLEGVKFDYVSAIDVLENDIDKTVLLTSSPITKIQKLPFEINYDDEIPENLEIVNKGPDPKDYNAGEIPLAVLMEGEFSSFYENRVKPFPLSENKAKSLPTKMVVISDGDLIKNQVEKNKPLELGYDKLANTFYGNKEFLLNTVNYLLEDDGLINIRTKQIVVPFLDGQKAGEQRTLWQVLNLLIPLLLLAMCGGIFWFFRRRKYAR